MCFEVCCKKTKIIFESSKTVWDHRWLNCSLNTFFTPYCVCFFLCTIIRCVREVQRQFLCCETLLWGVLVMLLLLELWFPNISSWLFVQGAMLELPLKSHPAQVRWCISFISVQCAHKTWWAGGYKAEINYKRHKHKLISSTGPKAVCDKIPMSLLCLLLCYSYSEEKMLLSS